MDNEATDKKNRIEIIIPIVIGIIVFAMAAFSIVFLMRYNFKADSSFYITLAKEQMRTGQFFPDGMRYSTALNVLTLNLIMIPLLNVCSNYVLVRQIAVLIGWIVLLILIYRFFSLISKKKTYISFIAMSYFLIMYVASECVDMLFFQAPFILFEIYLFAFLILFIKALFSEQKKIWLYLYCLGIVLVSILANLGEIRNILIFGIPSIFTVITYKIINRDKGRPAITRQDRILLISLFVSIVLAFAGYKTVTGLFFEPATTETMTTVGSGKYAESLLELFEDLFSMHGNVLPSRLIGVGGVMQCLFTLVAFFIYFILPFIMIKYYSKLQNEPSKVAALFCIISNTIFGFIVFMTGGAIETDRYLIPVYINSIILLVIFFQMVIDYSGKYKKWIICIIMIYPLLCNSYFILKNISSITTGKNGNFSQAVEGVWETLADHDLQYGYATFYNAQEYSVLSNGKVRVNNVEIRNNEISEQKWLTNDYYYNPENYKGKTFLMLTNDELSRFAPKGIDDSVLGRPIDSFAYRGFNIFVYDYNISARFISN